MNFDTFQGYFRAFRLDEVKIIGKDVKLDDECRWHWAEKGM